MASLVLRALAVALIEQQSATHEHGPHNLRAEGDDIQTRNGKFALGFVSGFTVEYAANDDSSPCINDLARYSSDGFMLWYIYENRTLESTGYQLDMAPYLLSVSETYAESKCTGNSTKK